MWTDTLASAQLTAAAAWVVATYAIQFGPSAHAQRTIAFGLVAWFFAVTFTGASGFLTDFLMFDVPGVGYLVGIPIATLTTLLLSTQEGRRRVDRASMSAIISVQFLRVPGFCFIILRSADRLPAPFAPVAGWGDILAGILAVPTMSINNKEELNTFAVLIWNIIGAADLFTAVSLGLLSFPGPLQIFTGLPNSVPMMTMPWIIIAGFLVPTLISLHIVVFYRMFSTPSKRNQGSSQLLKKHWRLFFSLVLLVVFSKALVATWLISSECSLLYTLQSWFLSAPDTAGDVDGREHLRHQRQ